MRKAAERRQELTEALVRAAETVIRREGLHALKARNLAKEVGCSLGAIYNVFPDMDALILRVNARTLADFGRTLERLNSASRKSAAKQANPAIDRLVQLAISYLDIAVKNRRRWRALFDHRMSKGRELPKWYRDAQAPLFLLVEEPLRQLRPKSSEKERTLLARSMFAAVHGVVSLGLDEKLMPVSTKVLCRQIKEIVSALGHGLLVTGKHQKD